MSKSLKNVINPDEIIARYGADSFRLYEMFMGPLREVKPWNTEGVEGVCRFLNKVWRLVIDQNSGKPVSDITDEPMDRDGERLLHQTIRKVTDDIESLSYNTAISQLMIFVNDLAKRPKRSRQAVETLVLLLSPMAPHICEELWQRLGHADTLAYEKWPECDEASLAQDSVTIVVQINGKPRAKLELPAGLDKDALLAAVKANPDVAKHTDGKTIVKEIAVPGRLVNLVVR